MIPTLSDFFSDLSIQTGSVSAELEGVTARGVLWQVSPDRFLLDVPEVARYLVENGSAITIEPAYGAEHVIIEQFSRMTPLAALLYQRGVLALHAAAVSKGDDVVLLAGDSGVGKSTLLMSLMQRGWKMLADDLAIVDLDERGQAIVIPASPEILLWPKSIEKLHLEEIHFPREGMNRMAQIYPEQFVSASRPLRAIFWLSVHNKDTVEIDTIDGADRFRAIGTLTYNSHIADAILDRASYMNLAVSISQSVPVHLLRRPRGTWSIEELTDKIAECCLI